MQKIHAKVQSIGELSEDDRSKFAEWAWKARDINCFDPAVIGYPRTVMLSAEDENGTCLYIPLQSVLMFDSIAPQPGLSPRKEALCLYKIGQLVEEVAASSQHKETYFLCKDDRVSDICAKHGFEEMVGYRILRKKASTPQE